MDAVEDFTGQEVLPLIKPNTTPHDIEVMSDVPIAGISTVLIPAYQFACREGDDRYKLLVEMETGSVVCGKESFVTKRLPLLDKLSVRERRILQSVFKHGSLGEDELVSAIGGSLDVSQDVSRLIDLGYVSQEEGSYAVTDNYVFTRLSKIATFDEIAYESLSYHEKRPAAISPDEMRDMLSKFTSVEDQFECFLVRYVPLRGEP